jgi:flagellar hook protein FlgE
MSSFSIALSGLTASSTNLNVTANNIANADTVGFKSSRAEFADVYASGAVNLNTSVTGEGVRLASTAQQFTQGNISTSSSNLDLAISGDGFFTLQDANGLAYTRNGQFAEDSNGNVVSSTGQALQVYPPLASGGFNTGALADLNLQTAQSAPLATTTGSVILNLPAGSTPPAVATFDPTNSESYNVSTSTTVYDSLGNSYPATMYFSAAQTATTVGGVTTYTPVPNTWNVNMTIGGQPAGPAQTLTFNTAGALTSTSDGTVAAGGGNVNFALAAPADGALPLNLALAFGSSTQYGGNFGVTSIAQNGYATGQLSTVAIDASGIVSAVYTNGRSTQLGQLAMANFPNPQGLKQLGDTNWSQTFTSGTVVQGTASSAGFGSIQAGALESSNVDLTTELVNMITAQRSFDANAQVITTANQESQTVIQISH